MGFKMVVWNSQGAKWDAFWTNWIAPIAPDGVNNTADVAGMLVESGWAPWVQDTEVVENGNYQMVSTASWYSAAGVANSPFCQGVDGTRQWKALWVPWVKTLNAMRTNSRCSMGATVLPYQRRFMGFYPSNQGLLRPVVVSGFAVGSTQMLTVLQVHLVSSRNAIYELNALTAAMSRLIPQGTTGLVVGDLNVDLQKVNYVPQDNRWHVLSTGGATQQSGGELDWALLYDPNGQYYQTATAQVLAQYKTGANQSDHSVMMYTVNI